MLIALGSSSNTRLFMVVRPWKINCEEFACAHPYVDIRIVKNLFVLI